MLDFRNFNTSETLASDDNEIVWVKAQTEDKIYFVPTYATNPDTEQSVFLGNLPACVIKFNGPCYAVDDTKLNIQNSILYMLEMLNIDSSGINTFEPTQLMSVSRVFMYPQDRGTGYVQDSTSVTIVPEGGDTPSVTATAVPVVEKGSITAINITNKGFGYSISPRVVISGVGTGAKGYAILKLTELESCGIPNNTFAAKIERAVDSSSINSVGKCPKFVAPTSAVIPLKSNIRTYGPYVSANFTSDSGGVVFSEDKDLVPWAYGSLAATNTAGQARANEFPELPLKISEAGSATIVGLPNLSLGQRLNSIGPFLNSINMTFGPNGVTTNLNFQTFTPKFGDLQSSVREQLLKLNAVRQKQLQFVREQSINHNKISQKVNKSLTAANRPSSPGRQESLTEKNTLQRVIVGENYNWAPSGSGYTIVSGQRIVVGIDKLLDSQIEMKDQWSNKAFMSLDGIFSPISISGGGLPVSGEVFLPRYMQFCCSSGGLLHKSSPISSHPPFITGSNSTSVVSGHTYYNLDIKNLHLNPLTNPSGNPYSSGVCAGHSIDVVGRGTGVPESGLMSSLYPTYSGTNKYSDDYRFLGLRGPLVLHAWGYDTDGKPIPNFIDDEIKAKSGIFQTQVNGSGLKDQFMNDWLQKPATWPVGPIDLRFDRNRGVWVTPPPYKTIVARITQSVSPYSSGIAAIINKNSDGTISYNSPLVDNSGNPVLENSTSSSTASNIPLITVVDRVGESYGINELVYAQYDSYRSEYIVVGTKKSPIKVGQFFGSWPKFTTKSVTVYTTTGNPNNYNDPLYEYLSPTATTVNVLNLFSTIDNPSDYDWCVFVDIGQGFNILLSAEC